MYPHGLLKGLIYAEVLSLSSLEVCITYARGLTHGVSPNPFTRRAEADHGRAEIKNGFFSLKIRIYDIYAFREFLSFFSLATK